MTVDGWTRAVRDRLVVGRLLPLGGPREGAWITEDAAQAVLRRAVRGLRGVRLGPLRIAVADPEGAYEPVVPPPPSALPPGPLRVTADCAATASEPLPATAARLRTALAAAAEERLGLVVTEVDLRVTALLEGEDADQVRAEAEPEEVRAPRLSEAAGEEPGDADEEPGDTARVAAAALSVPGVMGLTTVLGRAVHVEERQDGGAALPRRHARVEIAVGAEHRALDVAREVRGVVSEAVRDQPTVAVLVTSVG